MAEYAKQGNELMIDYDHASLAAIALDPALAGKAAGWFTPEIRKGELWAVNVRWTPPAEVALRAKEWRYMSPAFETDGEGRVTSLMNVAITNLPATRNLQPLMAANKKVKLSMDPEQVRAALAALVAGDETKCTEILTAMIAAAASDDPAAAQAASADADADKAVAAAETSPPAADAADGPPKKKDEPAAVAASIAKLMRLSNAKSFVDAVEFFEVCRASHIELEEGRAANAKERATLESAERRRGCVDLVVKAHRAPANVWADDKSSGPKAYLANMPMADFRSYVADAVKSAPKSAAVKPIRGAAMPVSGSPEDVDALGLTARERQICSESKCDPATFATLKARGIKA